MINRGAAPPNSTRQALGWKGRRSLVDSHWASKPLAFGSTTLDLSGQRPASTGEEASVTDVPIGAP